MPAYIIANIHVTDSERYKDYVAAVPALIAKHGGKYRVRGGDSSVLEGGWATGRLVVIEFPDRDAALGFYEDPAYVPLQSLRQSAAESDVLIVDGVD